MAYFVAIDAGGTKTDFVLADDETVLARVRTGTIKRMRVDASVAELNLDTAMRELAGQTGLALQSVFRTCVGAAGSSVPLVSNWLRENISKYVGGDVRIVDDVEVALNAAFHGDRGVLILAGTGSNAAARTDDGTIVTAGGWGPAFGDEGSGHAIGLLALRLLFHAIDEEVPSDLLNSILEFWHLDSLSALVEHANAVPAPDFSQLAPLVAASSERGDGIAVETIARASLDLVDLTGSVIRKLQRREGKSTAGHFRVALAGSVLREIEPMRTQLVEGLRSLYPEIEVLPDSPDPVMGALWQARQSAIPSSPQQRSPADF